MKNRKRKNEREDLQSTGSESTRGESKQGESPTNDSRLTAFALGELEGEEQRAVEAMLEQNPALRTEVDEIKSLGLALERELATTEAPAALSQEQRQAIVAAADARDPQGRLLPSPWTQSVGFKRLCSVAALVLGFGLLGSLFWIANDQDLRVTSSSAVGQAAPRSDREAAGTNTRMDAVSQEPLNGMGYINGNAPRQSNLGYGGGSQATPQASPNRADALNDLGYVVERTDREEVIEEVPEEVSLLAEAKPGNSVGAKEGPSILELSQYTGPGDTLSSRSDSTSATTSGGPPAAPGAGIAQGPGANGGTLDLVPSTGADGFFLGRGQELERNKAAPGRRYGDSDFDADSLTDKQQLRAAARPQVPGEDYDNLPENPFTPVLVKRRSTFSIDVDTASYANVRRFLRQGQLPPRQSVRIEELINNFSYDYPSPTGDAPFSVQAEIVDCPWTAGHRLLRVGLQGRESSVKVPTARNLVFLIDVSGSMNRQDKLPLVQRSLTMLVEALHPEDTIGLVTYAGQSGIALQPTPVAEKEIILAAIQALGASGSTNGAAGILDAYRLAQEHFLEDGVNRVVLATDGDFNVGISDRKSLEQLIAQKRSSRIFLSVLGFGQGNLKDSSMEALADKGNGNYAYIDSIREARKVLVRNLDGTLETIAKDVKLQIEFNPAQIQSYRLIGYENRVLATRDFNDDRKDAGEIGAGHSVTALYELVPVGADLAGTAPLRYADEAATPDASDSEFASEALFVALRYKEPQADESQLLEFPIENSPSSFDEASNATRFASAVASFGMLLRGSQFAGATSFEAVHAWAERALGDDPYGDRHEFLTLVDWAIQAALPR